MYGGGSILVDQTFRVSVEPEWIGVLGCTHRLSSSSCVPHSAICPSLTTKADVHGATNGVLFQTPKTKSTLSGRMMPIIVIAPHIWLASLTVESRCATSTIVLSRARISESSAV